MKKYIILFLLLANYFSYAQSLIASSGGITNSPSHIITYSIGETVVITHNSGSRVITQGFQQPKLKVITASNELNTNDDFIIYPNPTLEKIYFAQAEKIKSIHVFDNNGRFLFQKENASQGIDFQLFSSGIYLLEIKDVENKIFTKKIIKQ